MTKYTRFPRTRKTHTCEHRGEKKQGPAHRQLAQHHTAVPTARAFGWGFRCFLGPVTPAP